MKNLDALFGSFVVEASVRIDAPREDVWDLVTDIGRIKEFSPEVIDARWLPDGPTGPMPGARFEGTNLLGSFEWSRVCTVVDAIRPILFSYMVGDRFDGSPSTRWSFELADDEGNTVLLQKFAHVKTGRSGTRLLAEADPDNAEKIIEARREVLEKGMALTLAGIRRAIEES